ncbi:hypothetical protein CFOL_v3_35222 [Cephalotus follicularis]|uniref:23 kDa jasmonate-induced protein-like n=2 Tax=Cephalotus follicularis TaxID=3775 RepID=A0A1Q3DH25_CEPFO|nr:hypothetical protein CFOL_v3_35222 [Cephalotus follicularis]
MSSNVFGNPVTDGTLEAMAEYENVTITRTDRAYVALNLKNAEDKDVNALQYARNLAQQYGSGINTLCLIYNATGDIVELAEEHDWAGVVWKSPCPQVIANGQWGAFLHAEKSSDGSCGAVVYRGKRVDDQQSDWMMSWYNPSSGSNLVYTEIREVDHYANNLYWDYLSYLMKKPSARDTWNGSLSNVAIGRAGSSIFEGILTQEAALVSNV